MPDFNQTLRIRGTKLGVDDTYVDATLAEYAMSGHVRLVEDRESNPREWTVLVSQLKKWARDEHVSEKGDLADPTGPIWSLIGDLENHVGDDNLAPVESEMRTLVDELYRVAVRGQRGSPKTGE